MKIIDTGTDNSCMLLSSNIIFKGNEASSNPNFELSNSCLH